MKGALLLDVVIRKGSPILELLPGEDETLLVGRNPGWERSAADCLGTKCKDIPLLILYLCLNVVDSIRGLDLEGDSLSGESLYENLHGYKLGENEMENEE
jgi:hypothetical protein